MNNKSWYRLKTQNTDTAIRADWRFPADIDFTLDYGIWDLTADEIFSREWIDYLKTLNLDLKHVMLFYRGPRCKFDAYAHVDISPPVTQSVKYSAGALNFVLQGKGSSMVWYQTPPGPTTVSFTSAHTPYIAWEVSDLKEIDRVSIGKELILVRTSTPHTIEMGKEPRWCISIRSSNNGEITWEELVDHFRSLNILIER